MNWYQFSALSQNPVAAFPVGSKSSAQYPFDLKIPSLNIHSISKSRRSKSIRSQNPVAQNPFVLKIPSLKIHSISKSRRSKSIQSQNPVAQNPFGLRIPSTQNPFHFKIPSQKINYFGYKIPSLKNTHVPCLKFNLQSLISHNSTKIGRFCVDFWRENLNFLYSKRRSLCSHTCFNRASFC